jgi:tRNA 2-thiocytidine biosynthesis protein TtcA
MKSMPPKLMSDNGEHIVIRPLAYCREKDIEKYSIAREFPIIPCNLCGSQDGLQRQVVKEMLQDWDKRFPGRIETMFQAMQNIVPSHMIDKNLFDFAAVSKERAGEFASDTAFDREAVPAKPVGLLAEDDDESENAVVVQRLELSL